MQKQKIFHFHQHKTFIYRLTHVIRICGFFLFLPLFLCMKSVLIMFFDYTFLLLSASVVRRRTKIEMKEKFQKNSILLPTDQSLPELSLSFNFLFLKTIRIDFSTLFLHFPPFPSTETQYENFFKTKNSQNSLRSPKISNS